MRIKLPSVTGAIAATLQLPISIYVCWAVYTDQTDAGLAAILYFNMLGYFPLGMIGATFFPAFNYFLPQINFQYHSFMTFVPSIVFATVNWFVIGFIIGLILQAGGIGVKKKYQ